MKADLLKMFALPKYLENKETPAEMSKAIESKFEGLTDTYSTETKTELLSRLAALQEYIKSQEEPQEETQEQFGDGGDILGGVGEGAGALGSAASLLSSSGIFGAGATAALGAAGPIGLAAGAILPLAGELIGGGDDKDKLAELEKAKFQAANTKYRSDFAKGGATDPKKKSPFTGYDILAQALGYVAPKLNPEGGGSTTPNLDKVDSVIKPLTEIDGLFQDKNKTAFDYNSDPMKDFIPNPIGVQSSSAVAKSESSSTPSTRRADQRKEDKEKLLGKASEALRYAPIATNLLQLKNLDKPEFESFSRMDNRYKKDLVDENALRNQVQQQVDNTSRAVLGASGGSGSAARAGLLASQTSGTKALTDALISSDQINRTENAREQQFNAQMGRINLGQEAREKEINARNEGIYDSNKSALIGALGTEAGQIGKEERMKQMISEMGICYDSRGRYICGTSERVPDGAEAPTQKYDGGPTTDIFNSYLEQILAKKKS